MDEGTPASIDGALRATGTPGGGEGSEDLVPLVYAELRRVARSLLARERPGHTLQPTALVHEAYLRVAGTRDPRWDGRRHFFAAATEAMRRILIDQARRKRRLKRGGGAQRVELDAVDFAIEPPSADLLAVDEVLQKLEASDPRTRQIVNLRYFAGFTIQETADALGVSVKTVEREWRFVRAWLKDALAR